MLSESIVFEESASGLVGKYSQEAIHLLLLILSKPTLIAMANPSSLYILLDKVRKSWPSFQKEMIEITKEPQFRTTLARFRENKSSAMTLIKQQDAPSAAQLLPALTAVYCWDSGYVGPFIDNLRTKLRDLPLEFFPMFSMSTETVAYEIYPRINIKGGLPIYSGVRYEFLKEDSLISSKSLSAPWNLEAGKFYQMVVSDAYCLKRYLTGDLFECLGFYSSVPILRFVGREGLNYSFTGEKITAQQLLEVYDKAVRNGLKKEAVLTCFPKLNKDSVPSYVFVCCLENETQATVSLSAEIIDRLLMEINSEYASKRKSGRLAEPELVVDTYESIMGKLIKADPRYKNSSSAQFKPLPLYKIYWEDLQKGKRE